MSTTEQINPSSLDDEPEYGLFKDFKGTVPLAEIGKESEIVSSSRQGKKTMENGGLLGGAVRLPSVADVSGSLSTKITTTHQESHVTGEIIQNPSNSVLPGGFTFRSCTDERRGHLEYEIMFLKPLCDAIPNPAILWSNQTWMIRRKQSTISSAKEC
ncbi:hypothetical protein O6H91_22G006400 [Diphasiastrum complanatum]|uniref:Uncharacterized protein n=1 Tax=Diphasiastrum complanatum TaxID=34168 RepID=A0ACC2ACH3_DIPCM|nr:hypothetical protein O6H91_22G006400 [Diphasiastrum complanatum]